jgi:hypothetical protein
MGYPVMVEMFLKGSSFPFVGYKSIDIEASEVVPVITWDQELGVTDANVVVLSAQDSTGYNIDWSQTRWTFGDSSETQYGPVVTHKYPIDDTNMEYVVSMTLTRRNANGTTETFTEYKTIKIGSDEIKAVITAKLHSNGYLVLSAEDSEGRGLLLDRSVWLFEGEGDSQSLNVNQKVGTVEHQSHSSNENWSSNKSAGMELGTEGGPAGILNKITLSTSTSISGSSSNTYDSTSYKDFIDNTESFSTQNTHTGAVCRRYIGDYDIATANWRELDNIYVTLYVYRANADGGFDGESITAWVNLEDAAKSGGVKYDY